MMSKLVKLLLSSSSNLRSSVKLKVQRAAIYSKNAINSAAVPSLKTGCIGAGSLAAGSVFYGIIVYASTDEQPKKKIVVLGSGWGAVSFLRSITPGQYDIAVVSPENYFTFTPLLPSVTVGTVEGRSVAEPIRKILWKKHKNEAKYYESECVDIDVENNKVVCKDVSSIVGEETEFELEYDALVVAVGAETATYNIPGIKDHTHYLKNVQQAQLIRKNVMDSFETANIPGQSPEEVERLLHFVVVGGGPTGVEFAAELKDFVKEDMKKYYPEELVSKAKITLLDGFKKLLNSYDEEISRYTEDQFKSNDIDVVTSTFVTGVEEGKMTLMDANTKEKRSMEYGMCVWAAGIGPRPITRKLQGKLPGQNHRLGLTTDHHMRVKTSQNIFAVGDCAILQFEKASECVEELFEEADLDKDGTLSFKEFKIILDKAMVRYPHLCHLFNDAYKRSRKNAFKAAKGSEENCNLTLDEFREFLKQADSRANALPPTAQVAAQEGKYVGQILSSHEEVINNQDFTGLVPFSYNHLGSFAYIGDNRAVLQLPIIGAFKGWSIMWVWRAAYFSECVSLRMRTLILFDWIKSYVFGRDTSRI